MLTKATLFENEKIAPGDNISNKSISDFLITAYHYTPNSDIPKILSIISSALIVFICS